MKSSLKENLDYIKKEFEESKDLIIKKVSCGKRKCAVLYMLGLTDTIALSKLVVYPLMKNTKEMVKYHLN